MKNTNYPNSIYYNPETSETLTKLNLAKRYNVSFGSVVEKYQHYNVTYENSEPTQELESEWYLVHEGDRPAPDYTHNVTTDSIQLINGVYTQTYKLVEKSEDTLKVNTRNVRDNYLREYIDNNINNPLQWADMSEEDKTMYSSYRRYLLDYTQNDNWWAQAPKTLEEWKTTV